MSILQLCFAAGQMTSVRGMACTAPQASFLECCCGFSGTMADGKMAIGRKYLTFRSLDSTRNAMRLEDARSRMAWMTRVIDIMHSEDKGGAVP